MDFSKVSSVAIYPPIGIARVGNSPHEYFIGPIIPGQPATDPDDFRDKQGRIKRQAVRFYLFGLDEQGNVLGEIKASHGGVRIDWKVDIANKKAAWYDFDLAFDIPAAMGKYDADGIATPHGKPIKSARRNDNVIGKNRKKLMIEPTARNITGVHTNKHGGQYKFDDGKIFGKKVYLGELRTDALGRLIFLGGKGKSESFTRPKLKLSTFANNEGWHDDTSDGPVDATVTLPDNRVLQAEGAWVVTAPPNYAVGVQAFSTGYDLLLDVMSRRHRKLVSATPSFYKDIYPILKHLSINQWVNAGVSRDYGWGSAYNFENAQLIKNLSSTSNKDRPLRQTLFESFRNPDFKKIESGVLPPLYGDAVTFNVNSTDPRNWFALTKLQYANLQKWARGDFVVGTPPKIKKWNQMTPQEQADGLTEAALEETLGGPFHPGCEFTWPMRHPMMYQSKRPFRIKRRRTAKDNFGKYLTSKKALSIGGPLDGSSAGDITRWMAVPWQSDTSSCLSAYRAYGGEYLPTFWPARVPNDVLTEKDYRTLQSGSKPVEKKIQAFSPDSRKKWLRGFIYDYQGNFLNGDSIADRLPGVTHFTEKWYEAGIIVEKKLKADPNLFPKEVWVETGRHVTKRFLDIKRPVRPLWVDMNPRELR